MVPSAQLVDELSRQDVRSCTTDLRELGESPFEGKSDLADLVGVGFQIFGFERILQENGVDLDLKALLLLSAIIGFGGSELAGRDKMIAALRRLPIACRFRATASSRTSA